MINRRNIMMGIAGSALLSNIAEARIPDITFVAPASPGGSIDISGRLLARGITAATSIPITITNRNAGAGVEGTMHVLNSAPDSGNVLLGGPNGLFFSPARENLPYNSESFDPICMFSMASFVLAARSDRFRDIDDLLNTMRRRPINFAFSSSESRYLIDRMSRAVGGLDVAAVSYRGGADAVRDLHAGVVDVVAGSLASVAGGIQSGVLKLLAHTSDFDIAAYPNLPSLSTVLSSNDPALTTYHWHGLYLPKGAPQQLIRLLQDSTKTVCEDASFIADHVSRGMVSRYMNSNQLREHHAKMVPFMTGYVNWLRETSTR